MMRTTFAAAFIAVASFNLFGTARADHQKPQDNQQRNTHAQAMSDQEFVREAAIGGMAEVEFGRLAMQKAQDEAVKQFGARLARDHERMNQKLMQVANQQGLQVPKAIDVKHNKELNQFVDLEGKEFERAFLRHQVKDHEKDIAKFEAEAKNGKDPAIKKLAADALPTLREHLDLAKSNLSKIDGKNDKQGASTQKKSDNRR